MFASSTIDVPDSRVNEELWILTKVDVKFIGKIKCIESLPNDGYQFSYGSKTARLYD